MKSVFAKTFVLIFFCIKFSVCQVINPINSVTIIPQNPNNNDFVKVVVRTFYGEASVTKIGIDYEIYGHNLFVNNCQWVNFGFTNSVDYYDTVNVGKLPIGQIKLTTKIKYWNSIDSCNSNNFSLQVDSFYVSPNYASLNDINNFGISIYPNPVSDFINIIDSENQIMQIQLMDIFGRDLGIFDPKNLKIDLSGFSKGVYFLKLKVKDTLISEKIVIN